MADAWESDDCADVRAYHTHYSIPRAAALWCGVPADRLDRILELTIDVGRGIVSHPKVPCIEPRCRAMHEAIEAGDLECRREGKKITPGEHVAPERRSVSREALKAWIAVAFPASKPDFLFDAIERNTHSAITAESYRALKAAHDAKDVKLAEAKENIRRLEEVGNAAKAQIESMEAVIEKMRAPGQRAETTYLNIIGSLLDLLVGETPTGRKHSIFENQSAVIAALLGYHEGKPGISSRTLEEKFAVANRSLKGS